jgi:NAD(P)-dependent dehydrogenase (short-subunit alcohol dehydrogenase family)
MSIAWVTGATGAWGRAFCRALLTAGHDVVALGRRDDAELAAEAASLGRAWAFVPLDLSAPPPPIGDLLAAVTEPLRTAPDVLIHAAVSTVGDRAALVSTDYLDPAQLIDEVEQAMLERGSGRIGVLVPQNARLGMAGLGDLSAAQAALWTWCEARRDVLERTDRGVSLTVVIPPRTASATQRFVAQQSGRSAKLRPPDAAPLLRAVLAGRRRAGRRPVLAALAMVFR